jgi:hypothetical protein
MEQSPSSSEAKGSSASQEINAFYGTQQLNTVLTNARKLSPLL